MKTLNKVQLIGYLGKDPVIIDFQNGNRMAIMSLATAKWVWQEGTVPKKESDWHRVTLCDKFLIEKAMIHFIKGSHIMVNGRIRYRIYTDTKGIVHHAAEIIALDIVDLDR